MVFASNLHPLVDLLCVADQLDLFVGKIVTRLSGDSEESEN